MIFDVCSTFGCGKTLTNAEKLHGSTCTKHSSKEASIGSTSKIHYIEKHLEILAKDFEREIAIVEKYKSSKSSAIRAQRIDLLKKFKAAVAKINELINKTV